MKTLQSRGWAKIVAWILCVLCLCTGAASALGMVFMFSLHAYDPGNTIEDIRQPVIQDYLESQMEMVGEYYQIEAEKKLDAQDGQEENTALTHIEEIYQRQFAQGNTNFFFQAKGETLGTLESGWRESAQAENTNTYMVSIVSGRKEITQRFPDQEAADAFITELGKSATGVDLYTETETTEDGSVSYVVTGSYEEGTTETITVTGYVQEKITARDVLSQTLSWIDFLYAYRNTMIIGCIIGCVGALLFLGFLCYAAGHKAGMEGIVLNRIDRIPLDLYWMILVVLAVGTAMVVTELGGTGLLVPIVAVGAVIWSVLGISGVVTLVTRIKAGRWWDNTVIRRLGTLLHRGAKKIGKWGRSLFCQLPLFRKAAVVFLGFTLLEGLCIIGIYNNDNGVGLLWFLLKLAEMAGIIWLVLAMRTLQKGGEELSAGNLDYQVPLEKLRFDLKTHGENLNHIRKGIQTAVEEQTKAERMKTELITNVSHDIKTPLTSIVNYVDLLKKEELPSQRAREYVEVLDRQSAKLKKLTEDLVEASKATTGNLQVHLERTDLHVLLAQSVGEYEEKLAESKLTPILQQEEETLLISADGRLLWRVFDNLLSNICKYAQPGTRVYLSSGLAKGKVEITFRNISASPLNISSEELMERFVRGDTARSTSGSGLGLSIARSLTQLQGGTFEIAIDGDLFKATLTFPPLT